MIVRTVAMAVVALLAGSPGASGDVLHREDFDGCVVHLEADPASESLAVRSRRPEGAGCPLAAEALGGFLTRAAAALPAGGPPYRSLFLGRLVDHPWLGRFLAEQALADAAWSAAQGRPRSGGNNAYAAAVLARSGLVALVDSAFAAAGYRAGPPSIEKVLVSAAGAPGVPSWVPGGGRLPFDAHCHVPLRRVQ